jgi:hypothetical protein
MNFYYFKIEGIGKNIFIIFVILVFLLFYITKRVQYNYYL